MDRYRRVLPILKSLLHQHHLQHSPPHFSSISPLINALATRNFSTYPQHRSINFDTLKVVQRLEAEGFTPEQSKAVMELLKDVIDESMLGLNRTMVTREEQDKVHSPEVRVTDDRPYINKKSTLRN